MIKDRILHIIEVKRAPKGKTIQALGVTPGNFTGRNRESPINSDALAKLYTLFPDINLAWLLTGDGDMFTTPAPHPSDPIFLLDRLEEVIRENERLRLQLSQLTK